MGRLYELNHRHIAIAEYLIRNPAARLDEVSAAVGLTPSWVSTLTNSELFRNYLRERHNEVAGEVTVQLQEKLLGVAHSAVEKLGRKVDESNDANFILAVADKALKNLGFGAPKGPTVQVNNVSQVNNVVSAEVLASAREKFYQLAESRKDGPTLPPAEGVQTRGDGRVGHTALPAAPVYSEEEAEWEESPGPSVREESARPFGGLAARPFEEPLD